MADSACSSCSSAGSCSSESCEGCPSSKQPQSFQEKLNEYSSVKKVIGVVSGKGGVGKSFVTASLATAMRKKGYEVGILDADITGYGQRDGNPADCSRGWHKDYVHQFVDGG